MFGATHVQGEREARNLDQRRAWCHQWHSVRVCVLFWEGLRVVAVRCASGMGDWEREM